AMFKALPGLPKKSFKKILKPFRKTSLSFLALERLVSFASVSGLHSKGQIETLQEHQQGALDTFISSHPQQRRNGLVFSLDLSSKKPAFLDSFILMFVNSYTSVKPIASHVRHQYYIARSYSAFFLL